jgi:DNA repair protein RecN (Recombination protein N)
MLSHLIIRNFAIIDELEIPFRDGYTVFTGETGAGKSIIIDALNLILGGRASTEVIRTGEDEATVEGGFEPSDERLAQINEMLEERGIETGDELIIRRRVRRSGRNKVFINGSLSTVSALREATRGLVDISGQHEHYSLLDADRHVDVLDRFAELDDERDEMAEAYDRVRQLRSQLEELQGDVRERMNRIDFLEYQLSEIEDASPEPGEDEELQAEFDRLKHAEEIGESARRALDECYAGTPSAVEKLAEGLGHLREAARHDGSLDELVERLEAAKIEAEELALRLQDYVHDIDVDPERLDAVVERTDLLNRLKRKHDVETLEQLVERADEMRAEIDKLRNAESRTEQLRAELEEAEREAFEIAYDLGEKRRRAAERVQFRIEDELDDLNMENTKFVVDIEPDPLPDPESELDGRLQHEDEAPSSGQQSLLETLTLSARGFDDVEFLIAPNVGEKPQPLAKIASGGELSRIMLAIKSVLVERDDVETYVFDEVDAGIGGTTADAVGQKIARTANTHQVVCITHLPQIASRASHHFHVEKTEHEGRTHTVVQSLGDDDRVDEVARMLAGRTAKGKARETAREMLVEHG